MLLRLYCELFRHFEPIREHVNVVSNAIKDIKKTIYFPHQHPLGKKNESTGTREDVEVEQFFASL